MRNINSIILPQFVALFRCALVPTLVLLVPGCLNARRSDVYLVLPNSTAELAPENLTSEPSSPVLGLMPEEFEDAAPLESATFQWQPFLLPLKEGVVLNDIDFLLGTRLKPGTPLQTPIVKGSCAFFAQTQSQEPARNVTFRVRGGLAKSKGTEGRLFFLHSGANALANSKTLGFGVLDENGQANCQVDQLISTVSADMGSARQEEKITVTADKSSQNNVEFDLQARMLLDVVPGPTSRILPGDILRIGRLAGSNTSLEMLGQSLKTSVENDLFKTIDNASENFGVTEYLRTNILVGEQPFSISVTPGRYKIAVLKKNNHFTCFLEADASTNLNTELTCAAQGDPNEAQQPSSSPNTASSANSMRATPGALDARSSPRDPTLGQRANSDLPRESLFDATFFPERLIQAAPFQRFLLGHGAQLYLKYQGKKNGAAPASSTSNPVANPISTDLEFSFYNANPERLLPAINSTAVAERLLTAISKPNVEEWVRKYVEKSDHTTFPIGGTSESGFVRGAVPLVAKTIFRAPAAAALSPDKNDSYITNGASLEWIEPQAGILEQPLRMPTQQRFRAKVVVPPWNAVEFVTLFVNSKVYRRWVLPRVDLTLPYTFLIDERIEEKADFDISLFAWGNRFLPEFLTGATGLLPMALSRQLCVDVNENGLCETRR